MKANVAEEAGASAILIINNQTELFKMVCESDADVDIKIPALMLPQDAGSRLEKYISNNTMVSVALYSPKRPAVDIAEVFLWLMAVGTILCASYWSAWTAREVAIEQDKLLKDASEEILEVRGAGSSGFVDINTMSAIFFVVAASCFLVMLYKLMSFWFVEVLVVLFCIGGVEKGQRVAGGVGEDSFEMNADPRYPFMLPGLANVLGDFVIMNTCIFFLSFSEQVGSCMTLTAANI
ncbi:hypothetical protein Gotri_018073 [Gossypium trilobum]|uniref:PA domain-containing protein n=1 Tax=Gossypium trilobum TaxID=34281 RepID=A0A7J9E937_9ROSI|nr:hypothetical protein [Gossypium trilobum]